LRPAIPADAKPWESPVSIPPQPPVLVPLHPPPLPTATAADLDLPVPTSPEHTAVAADIFDIDVDRETPTLPTMPAVIPIAEQDTQPRVKLADIKPPEVPWPTTDPQVSAQELQRRAAATHHRGSWWNGLFGKR
jgi:hypothetical protein